MNVKLKKLREKNDLSLQQMAEKVGISKPYYWQIENGKRNLYYKLAIKIADVFKVMPDDLFYDYYKLEK